MKSLAAAAESSSWTQKPGWPGPHRKAALHVVAGFAGSEKLKIRVVSKKKKKKKSQSWGNSWVNTDQFILFQVWDMPAGP